GARGITPVGQTLSRIATDYPGPRRFLYFPSALWLGCSDRTLRGMAVLGGALGLLVAWGGALSRPALLGCWALYLSFDVALDLAFPWECALLEAGLLSLLLPELRPLPALAAVAAPLPAVAWAYRLLLFRIMLGFGKLKF